MSTMVRVDLRHGVVADLPIVDQMMQAAFDPRFGEAWTRNQVLGLLAMPGVWLTIATIAGAGKAAGRCALTLHASSARASLPLRVSSAPAASVASKASTNSAGPASRCHARGS